MTIFDYMLLFAGAATWCAMVVLPTMIGDIFEILTNEHWQH
jgi:hypothetical protein